jgi:hypothetical protein
LEEVKRRNQIHTKIGIMDGMVSKILLEGAISGDVNGFYLVFFYSTEATSIIGI